MMKHLILSLRPKQWIKNFFVFLPLLFGQKLFAFPHNLRAALTFCLFSLAASASYLINDIIDKESDTAHPLKRLRPVASGELSVKHAAAAAIILGAFTIISSFFLSAILGYIITAYLIVNYFYSRRLKRIVIIDVFCISGFFLLRVMAGSIAADVVMSHWIVIMTGLLALFLGFNKRRQELKTFEDEAPRHRQVLARYDSYFIDQMTAIITSSIVVAYMLYTVDARTVGEFGTKNLAYSIPFVYYGLFRYLYLIHKTESDGDPTRVLLSDRMMQLDILLWMIICAAVIYFGH